jgi:hypothetical protein
MMANPQQPRDSGQPARKEPNFDQNNPAKQAPGRDQNGRDQAGRDPSKGKVGQDTDGDGKVVKAGQTPGQSHGQGLDNTSGRPQPSGQKQGAQQPHSHGNSGAEPENPADLGHDPKPDNIQAGGRK